MPVALAYASVPLAGLMCSTGGQIWLVSPSVLSPGLSSMRLLEKVKRLVTVPAMSARVTRLAVALEPLGNRPSAHWSTPPEFVVVPRLLVAERKLRLGGRTVCTTASETVAGPRLVTARLKVSRSPVRRVGTQ